ncbi:MAG: FAD-dependent oxidoreductase [Lachnospiraceae bacterium]|nr:FAD-dependent oxidoreductase [Lachnospiraceae bacterium]
MIRLNQLKVEKGAHDDRILEKTAKKLHLAPEKIKEIRVIKRSLDARNKGNILDVYCLEVTTCLSGAKEKELVSKAGSRDVCLYERQEYDPVFKIKNRPEKRPVIAGFGPAGIFLAYVLSLNGLAPLVVERGKSAGERRKDVEDFFRTGRLDPDSNVQFGEGGAGTFSDGKLNTLIKDEKGRGRFVLETFVKFGADPEILIDSKPHIGTDILMKIIPAMREEIIKNGGEVRFDSTLTGYETDSGKVSAVIINGKDRIETDDLFLCIGHSARDTFRMLYEKGVKMEPKAFAVGVRVEHERKNIDEALHRDRAAYKLTHKCRDGRGVYTFCMCPGGQVINASSEDGGLCVNGMSFSGRDGKNSNSAVVVTVKQEDFPGDEDDPLRGILFQRELEKKAYELGGGSIPYERYKDFKEGSPKPGAGRISPSCACPYVFADLRSILPEVVAHDIIEGIDDFGKKIRGFDDPETLLAGIESRTSSPVRITRNGDFESDIRGLFPVGEGAGYAGGIMSAAIDALKCAEHYYFNISGERQNEREY